MLSHVADPPDSAHAVSAAWAFSFGTSLSMMFGVYQVFRSCVVNYVATIKGREPRFWLRLAPRDRRDARLPARLAQAGPGRSVVSKRVTRRVRLAGSSPADAQVYAGAEFGVPAFSPPKACGRSPTGFGRAPEVELRGIADARREARRAGASWPATSGDRPQELLLLIFRDPFAHAAYLAQLLLGASEHRSCVFQQSKSVSNCELRG